MLKVLEGKILIERIIEKQEWVIARVKNDNVSKWIVLISWVKGIDWGEIVHFPIHTPQKIEHKWDKDLYVIKEEDVLLISVPEPKVHPKPLDPKNDKKWQK